MHLKYGPIRVVALGGNGLIRGRLLNSHTCQIYPSLQNGLYSNVHLQYKAWIINPWRYRLMRMNSQSLKIWADRYEWQVWILNLWRYGPTGMNSQFLKVWAEKHEFEDMGWEVWILILWRYGWQVWILNLWKCEFSIFEGMGWQV